MNYQVAPEPPCNVQAEQAVLGAVLMDNNVFGAVAGDITEADFSEPAHAAIWRECARRITAGRQATPITLRDALPDIKIAHNLTLSQYLARLCAESVGTMTARSNALAVRELAHMREVIAIAEDLQYARAAQKAPDVALREAWERLDALRGATGSTSERGSLAAFVDRARREREDGQESTHVVSTGLADLDAAIGGGWRSRRLYIGAGRPGMGKTVLGASTARKVARQGVGVLIQSLELDGQEILARITADETSAMVDAVEYSRILSGRELTGNEMSSVERAQDAVAKLPIEVDASGGISMVEIEARARVTKERMARRGIRLGLVVIDYLTLIKRSDRYRGNPVNELGEIALAAKTMSKRLDVAVLLLSQLNRGVESRDDKRPNMSDLRASGEIEEHADVVMLLFREAYYLAKDTKPEAALRAEERKNVLELTLGKNRLGPTKTVELWCSVGHSAIENLAKGA